MPELATNSAHQFTARERGRELEMTRMAQSTVERTGTRLDGRRRGNPSVALGSDAMRLAGSAQGFSGANG